MVDAMKGWDFSDEESAESIRADAMRVMNVVKTEDPWHLLAVCGHVITVIFAAMKQEHRAGEMKEFIAAMEAAVAELEVRLSSRKEKMQ